MSIEIQSSIHTRDVSCHTGDSHFRDLFLLVVGRCDRWWIVLDRLNFLHDFQCWTQFHVQIVHQMVFVEQNQCLSVDVVVEEVVSIIAVATECSQTANEFANFFD